MREPTSGRLTSTRPLLSAYGPAFVGAIGVCGLLIVGALGRGGAPADTRTAMALIAVASIIAAVALGGDFAAGTAVTVAIAALALLSVVTAASLAWSSAPPRTVVSQAILPLVYGAALALGVIAGRIVEPYLVAGIAVAATVVVGLGSLGAAVAGAEPWAVVVGGAWRPAGPAESPSALAGMTAAAVPAAVMLLDAQSRTLRVLGAIAAPVCAATLWAASSRAGIAFALLGTAWICARTPRLTGAATIAAGSGLVAGLALEPAIDARDPRGGVFLALTILVAGATLALWWMTRRPVFAGFPKAMAIARRAHVARGLGVGALVLGGTAILLVLSRSDGPEPYAGLDHGRLDLWSRVVSATAENLPWGAGAGASRLALLAHDPGYDPGTRFVHSFPLEAALELGVIGAVAATVFLIATVWPLMLVRPAVLRALACFPLAFIAINLIDWSWHLPLVGVFAMALGGAALVRSDQDPLPERLPHRSGRLGLPRRTPGLEGDHGEASVSADDGPSRADRDLPNRPGGTARG